MLDEIESKTVHEDEEDDRWGKRSKILREVKPVENISKNVHNFLNQLPESNESSRFFSHRTRMSGEFD